MRVLRSLSLLALLVPGLLTTPALATAAAAAPVPVAAGVQEISVRGVDRTASTGAALRTASTTRTVLLTGELGTHPFALVGVTWAHDPRVGSVAAAVRTRTDGTWSPWTPLGGTADEQPDLAGVDTGRALRGGTSPLWVGAADGVQARVDVLSGADPTDLRLSLVDPGESPADAAVPIPTARLTTSAASFAPVVRSRAAWGANESIRTVAPSYASSIHAVIVHHTASSNDYTEADVPRLLRGFYAYHVTSNGWSDIGYNVVVDKFGRIWEGRAGGITRAVIGSHAGGFNTGTVGISVIGTYDTVALSAAAREAVAQIAGWRLGLVGKDPAGTVNIRSGGSTRFPNGQVVTLPRIFGHRDVSTTACPGDQSMAALPGLRTRARAIASGVTPAPVAEPEPTQPPTPTPPPAPAPVAASREGLVVTAPTTAPAGETVGITVAGGAGGAPVEVWFARRGDPTFSRRREAVFAPDGTFQTSYVAQDDYTFFAVSADRTSNRVTTRIPVPPPLLAPPRPTLLVTASPSVDAGAQLVPVVSGPAGKAVDLWRRTRGERVWSRVAAGRLDQAGRWAAEWAAVDDHEYFATAEGLTSADAATITVPVVNGPPSAALGSRVVLDGRARPGDQVVVESRRRGETVFGRVTLTADATGAFRTSYAADDEYEYRAVGAGRSSTLHRTTVAPTALGAPTVPSGAVVALSGTARPGARVEVLFRRPARAFGIAGRPGRTLPFYAVGRVATAGPDGRWATTFTADRTTRWFARSDGNTTRIATTALR